MAELAYRTTAEMLPPLPGLGDPQVSTAALMPVGMEGAIGVAGGLVVRFHTKEKVINRSRWVPCNEPVENPDAIDHLMNVVTVVDGIQTVVRKRVREPQTITEDWCEVRIPGNTLQVVDLKVTPERIAEFPDAYAAWKSGGRGTLGIPLQALGLPPERIRQLHALNIFSVEGLASLGDHGLANLGPGGLGLRGQAQVHLRMSQERGDGEAVAALQEQVASQAQVNQQLMQMLAAMQEQIAAMSEQTTGRKARG